MKIISIIRETFLLLRRDKVFLPAVVIAIGVFLFANLASDWGIEEFFKILYDIGTLGFLVIGVVIAIFWGTKLITDSKQQGALEIQMASPINRLTWLVGRYLGICMTLLFLSVCLVAVWQGMLLLQNFGWLGEREVIIFAFLTLHWTVVAAVATFFAAISSQAVATFCTLCVWFAGLASTSIVQSLSPETPPASRFLVETMAKVWNLQIFNLSDFAWNKDFPVKEVWPSVPELWQIAAYGFCLILILITLACISFSRKDLTSAS